MPSHDDYRRRSTWKYPRQLINLIISEMKLFFKEIEHEYENFTLPDTFTPLSDHVKEKTGVKPTLRWLKDLYTNQKTGKELKKSFFTALLQTFNYDYDEISNSFRKKNFSENIANPDEDPMKGEEALILASVAKMARKNKRIINLFVGKYKYFLGARKNSIYDYIYENDLEIFKDGRVLIYNPFSKQHYIGIVLVRNEKTLQVLSFDSSEDLINGVGNLISFKIDMYGRIAILIPGVSLSFDAGLKPIASQVLLSADLSYDKKSEPIREYFDTLASDLRLNCPDPEQVEQMLKTSRTKTQFSHKK